MNSRIFILILLAVIAVVGRVEAARPKGANPNDTDPALPLAVHGEGVSVTLQDLAQDRYELLVTNMQILLTRQQKGLLPKIDPQLISKAQVAMSQCRRGAEQLACLGEPVGPEFNRRCRVGAELRHLGETYGAFSDSAAYVAQIRALLTKNANARAATLKKLEQLAEREQWEEAEKVLHDTLDKLDAATIFLPLTEAAPYYEPFSSISSRIHSQMAGIRSKAGLERLQQRIEQQTPEFDALLADLERTTTALQSSATVEVEGEMVTGPQAFTMFATRFHKTHVSVQRLLGLQLASYAELLNAGGTLSQPNNKLLPAIDRYTSTFTGDMLKRLAAMIDADARRASAEEAPQLHAAYLKAAAPLCARLTDSAARQTLSVALARLAAKSPEYAARTAQYQAATGELLRWRARLAQALADTESRKFETLSGAIQSAFQSEQSYNGLYIAQMPEFDVPRFLASTPEILPKGAGALLRKNVTAQGVRGVGKSHVSTLHQRTFASLKGVSADVASALQALEADLFVSEQSAPLSLDASIALESARSGDYVRVGGEVTAVTLEALVTRLAALPDAAGPLVPLGTVPVVPAQNGYNSTLSQAVVRCDLKPKWVQHEAFFVKLQ